MAHGGKMWSLSGPQLHSEGSWLAHSLWRWNRKWQQAWNHATAWRSVFTITVYNFCHNVRHILTVVWHHEQVFPCKPLIFFWHLSHFPDSQFPLTQSWVEIWGEKHTRNNKIITPYYKYSILDSYTKEKQDQTSRVLERSHPIQLSRSHFHRHSNHSKTVKPQNESPNPFCWIFAFMFPTFFLWIIARSFRVISPTGWTAVPRISHLHPFLTTWCLSLGHGKSLFWIQAPALRQYDLFIFWFHVSKWGIWLFW